MRSFAIVCIFVAAALLTWVGPAKATDCFVDPSDPACATFTFDPTEASTNTTAICGAFPETTGCFVRQMCEQATSLFGLDERCSKLAIFFLTCRDQASSEYCNGYNALCAAGSVVEECQTPYIEAPSSDVMKPEIIALCTNDAAAYPASVGCQETYSSTELAIIAGSDIWMGYSKICSIDDNSTAECSDWRNLCAIPNKTDATYANWPFCDPFAATPMTCLDKPTAAACIGYTLPTVESDISNLCYMMINMPGCSLNTVCKSNSSLNTTSPYCMDRFSILKVICLDMPGMSGCSNYKKMCATGSQVEQCGIAVPDMPMTMYLSGTAITPLCAGTTGTLGDACNVCVGNKAMCDLLGVYSAVCYGSSNSLCAKYDAACASAGMSAFPWCNAPVLVNASPAAQPAANMDAPVAPTDAPVMPPSAATQALASFVFVAAMTLVAMSM